MTITEEQLKELEGIYQMSHKCKDAESLKLAKSIFKTINFIDLENYSIDSGYFYYDTYNYLGQGIGDRYFRLSERRDLITLPIVVILYLITQDDKYLKPSKYVKDTITIKKKVRTYIKFSSTCYFTDILYTSCKIEDIFK